jgi:glycerol uptake facilitator protein
VNLFHGEFLGTMILILLGDGVVAGVLLGKSKAKDAGWIAVTAGWAFGVLCGVIVARMAGAPGYINPAGVAAGLVLDKVTPADASYLIAGELLGAFVGAVLVWLHYLPHWAETDDPGAKLAVFCTGPAVRNPFANVVSETIGTFVLVFVGAAIVEKTIGSGFLTPMAAALVWGIGLSLGGTTGYAINPARDLGPRVAHALLPIPGKGPSDWGYAWVPVVGPLLGAVLAALAAKSAFPPGAA